MILISILSAKSVQKNKKFEELQIFVAPLKSRHPYIAIVLIVLFAVTLLPYNALHHHAEDEHVAAMLHHEHHPSHHCELDDMSCQIGPDEDCGHDTHLSKTHLKCFSCEFHFVKVFGATSETLFGGVASTGVSFQQPTVGPLHGGFLFVGNKGPPVGV